MPTTIHTDDVKQTAGGDGWRVFTLADAAAFGAAVMTARRWEIDPGATTDASLMGAGEQLLYVIRGGGSATVDGAVLPLAAESVLWLEPGEQFAFTGGPDGLVILQGTTTARRE